MVRRAPACHIFQMPISDESQKANIKRMREMIRLNEENLIEMKSLLADLEKKTSDSKNKVRGGEHADN